MALTDTEVRQAKHRDRPYKLYDENGLFLLVKGEGQKYWRWKYRFAGKEKLLALGVYPAVRLAEARDDVQGARSLLRKGVDPSQHRKLQKVARTTAASNTFESIASEWLAKQSSSWVEGHTNRQRARIEAGLLPWIGARPIAEITAPELLAAVRRTESRGALETARRLLQLAGHIFRYAIATSRCDRDPSQDLRGALEPPQVKHRAAVVDPQGVGALLLSLDAYRGTPAVETALKLAPLTFVRPGELRSARWAEFDLKEGRWAIPAARMKMRHDHIVPLSRQAVALLTELQPITGTREYVFPSGRSPLKPMSDNAVLSALRSSGIDSDTMCGHGFRAMARTLLDEVLGFRVDLIEHQLAHAVKDPTGRAYNRTSHLDARKTMMQEWADYLDRLRAEHLDRIRREQNTMRSDAVAGP